jgi:hypothetical protein
MPWLEQLSPNSHIAAEDDVALAEPLLIDLQSDPGEKTNVAAQHSEVVERLLRAAAAARQDIGDYDCVGVNQRFFDEGVTPAGHCRQVCDP